MNDCFDDLRCLFDHASDLAQVASGDGALLYTNQTWLRVLAYSAAEVGNLSFWQVLHPDNHDYYRTLCADLQINCSSGLVQLTLVTRGGKSVVVEGTVCQCTLADGRSHLWGLWRMIQQPAAAPLNPAQSLFGATITQRTLTVIELQRLNVEDLRVQNRTAALAKANQGLQQAYQELQTQKDFLQRVIDSVPSSIYVKDVEGRIIIANQATANVHGSTVEAILGKRLGEFKSCFDAAQIEAFQREDQAVIQQGQTLVKEDCIVLSNQQTRWCQTTLKPFVDLQGRVLGIMGNMVDITEIKQIEQEQSLRLAILEATSDFVGTATLDGQALYINRAGRQMVGLDQEDPLAQLSIAQCHPAWATEIIQQQALPDAIRSGLWQGETAFLGADGQEIPVSQVVIAHKSEEGELKYFSTIARDIRNRKRLEVERSQAEAALHQSEERLRRVIDSAPVVLYALDQQGRFTLSEGKGLEALGLQPGQVVGALVDDLYQEYPEVLDQVKQALLGQDVQSVVTVGDISYETRYCPLRDENGTMIGVTGVAVDVTERKRAEIEILRALKKEKELSELKSRFVTMVSHEFRTPLAVIQSATDLLYHYNLDVEEQRAYLSQIHTTIQHMTHLLEDVLLIGKIDSENHNISCQLIDLSEFCQQLVAELQLAHGKDYLFEFCIHGEPILVSLDPKLLKQIFTNLLANAAKYSAKNSKVLLHLVYEAEQVMLQVKDQGIGIPAADQAQLFQAFHRAHNVGNIKGTGLGLAIVKRCVDLLDGQIAVESAVDLGTTFTVLLPLSAP
jgi:PAS domain S-box-containing protein